MALLFADLPVFAGAAVLVAAAFDSVPVAFALAVVVVAGFRAFVYLRRHPVPPEDVDSPPTWKLLCLVATVGLAVLVGATAGAFALLALVAPVGLALPLAVLAVVLSFALSLRIQVQRGSRRGDLEVDGLAHELGSELTFATPWLLDALPHHRPPPPGPA